MKQLKEAFKKQIQNHDWFYEYSDDSRVWRIGSQEREELENSHAALSCPFSINELCRYVHKSILENFEEVHEDYQSTWCNHRVIIRAGFYEKGQPREGISATEKRNLITQTRYDEIQAWFGE